MKISLTHWIARKVANYDSPSSIAFKMRQRRAKRITSLISECYVKYGRVSIIDIGGTRMYWKIISTAFLKEKNVHITIVNLPSSISSLFDNDEIFTLVEGDGCNLSKFSDHSFHIAHSNSVIEHVGNWDKKTMFAKELCRIAKNYYLQTPNYWFPLEPHFMFPFFHWLPKNVRIKLALWFTLGWFHKAVTYEEAKQNVESCSLLSKKDLLKLFPDGVLYKEKLLFFTKSLIVIKSNIHKT
jgi:hypothetical protein